MVVGVLTSGEAVSKYHHLPQGKPEEEHRLRQLREGQALLQRMPWPMQRIRDVIGYVKPSSYKLYEQTQADC